MTIYNFISSSKISLSLSPIASSINISPTHDSNCYKRKKGSSPRLVDHARFVSILFLLLLWPLSNYFSLSLPSRRADISRAGSSPINVAGQEMVNLRPGAVENERPPIIGLIVINVSEQPRPAVRSFIAPRIFMSVGESLVAPIRFGQIHLFTAARGPLHARTHARTQIRGGGKRRGVYYRRGRGVGRRVWAVSEDGIGIGERKWLKAIAFGDIRPRVSREECNYGRIKASWSCFERFERCTRCPKKENFSSNELLWVYRGWSKRLLLLLYLYFNFGENLSVEIVVTIKIVRYDRSRVITAKWCDRGTICRFASDYM